MRNRIERELVLLVALRDHLEDVGKPADAVVLGRGWDEIRDLLDEAENENRNKEAA